MRLPSTLAALALTAALAADLTNSFNLTPANSILIVIGTGLTASLTRLAFDHAAGNGAFGIVQASNGICLDAAATTPGCNNAAPSASVRVAAVIYGISSSGQTEIATAATATRRQRN